MWQLGHMGNKSLLNQFRHQLVRKDANFNQKKSYSALNYAPVPLSPQVISNLLDNFNHLNGNRILGCQLHRKAANLENICTLFTLTFHIAQRIETLLDHD